MEFSSRLLAVEDFLFNRRRMGDLCISPLCLRGELKLKVALKICPFLIVFTFLAIIIILG